MPTGYTAKLMGEGQSFKEFAMLCARAMGACISMKDDPFDKTIPEKFSSSDYYTENLQRAKNQLKKFKKTSSSEIQLWGSSQIEKMLESTTKAYNVSKEEDQRLSDMKKHVLNWNPPTPEHENFKKFMLEQIDVSFNNMSDYYNRELKNIKKLTPNKVFVNQLKTIEGQIKYYNEQMKNETKSIESKNNWISELRNSLEKEV